MTALFAHPSLPGLIRNLSNPSARALGALGEQLVYLLLEQNGYTVSAVHPGEKRGDLRVVTPSGEIMRVEVKTSRRAPDGKWRFRLYKPGHTDHKHSDVVILLCIARTGYSVPFVIPTDVLRYQTNAVISSNPYVYAGKFAPYRQKMHALKVEVQA